MSDDAPLTLIHHLIVHTITRNKDRFVVQERDDELPRTDLAQRLVDQLHAEYRGRHAKSYGCFDGDAEKSPAQVHIRKYVLADQPDFHAFSGHLVKLLCDKMQRTSARGGHVFVAYVTADDHVFLLIAILTDETAIALSRNQDLEPTIHLDVKGFRFAGRVDVSAWQASKERYVSFLKGTKQAADYFKEFLGCSIVIAALKDTRQLTKAVVDFAKTAKRDDELLTLEERGEWLAKVDAKCRKLSASGDLLHIEPFCNELWPEDPTALIKAMVENETPVNDGFVPNTRGLGGLVHFRAKSNHWKVEFEREALNDRTVVYNADKRTLTLSRLPDELVERLQADAPPDEDT